MSFLLSHWHCILPIGIIALVILFSGKSKEAKTPKNITEMSSSDFSKSLATLENRYSAGEITEAEYLRKRALIEQ